jgi:hypothetical protein
MFQATNIIQEPEIFKHLTEIQGYCEAHYNQDNPAAVLQRGQELESFLALTGKLVADSKYWQDQFLNSAIKESIEESLKNNGWSVSTINKKIGAVCKENNYLVNWSERLNAAITHQLDFLRSVISKQKEEMRQMQWQK